MDAVFAILVILIAFLAGLFGSMLGLGGGFLMVPVLTLGLNVDIRIAISASLIGIIANSSTASATYLKKGFTNVKLGLVMANATVIGAIVGAVIGVIIFKPVLFFIFAIALIVLAVFMYLRPERDSVPKNARNQKSATSFLRIQGEYYDNTVNMNVKYEVGNLEKGLGGGFIAGSLSGILGIGGGIVNVPVMNMWMDVPLKAAIATSTFMIGLTAVAGALVYYSFGYVSSVITVLVIIGIFLGATTGSRLAPKIKTGILKKAFIGVLVIISVLMFLKSFGLLPT